MDVHIHSSNRRSTLVKAVQAVLLISPFMSMAIASERGGASVLTDADMSVIDQGRELQEQAPKRLNIDDYFPPDANTDRRDAEKFFSDLSRTNPTLREHTAPQGDPNGPGERYAEHETLLFASFSLERQGLEDILQVASDDPSIAVIFRGIPDDMEVSQGVMFIQSLATQYDPVPTVVIDPTLYRDHNVTEVPTLIRIGDTPRPEDVIARVTGLTEPQWLDRHLIQGNRGDFGTRGPVAEVIERDLIEVMQERVAGIDWAQKRENAAKRFWSGQRFQWLPAATRPRTRELDPRVRVYEDILGAEGEVIAARGTIINPLDTRPFDQAVIIFNGTDPREMELVAERLPGLTAEAARVTFIATEMDSDEGWDAYKEVTDYFDAPVYLLTPELIERFQLEFTPSVITSDGTNFIIQELVRGRDEG